MSLQDLYPDVARKVYVIRAPAAFQVAYNMIYPVLSKQTRSKVESNFILLSSTVKCVVTITAIHKSNRYLC